MSHIFYTVQRSGQSFGSPIKRMHVDLNDSVWDIKYQLYRKEDIPPPEMRLRFERKYLDNEYCLNDYKILAHSTLHLERQMDDHFVVQIGSMTWMKNTWSFDQSDDHIQNAKQLILDEILINTLCSTISHDLFWIVYGLYYDDRLLDDELLLWGSDYGAQSNEPLRIFEIKTITDNTWFVDNENKISKTLNWMNKQKQVMDIPIDLLSDYNCIVKCIEIDLPSLLNRNKSDLISSSSNFSNKAVNNCNCLHAINATNLTNAYLINNSSETNLNNDQIIISKYLLFGLIGSFGCVVLLVLLIICINFCKFWKSKVSTPQRPMHTQRKPSINKTINYAPSVITKGGLIDVPKRSQMVKKAENELNQKRLCSELFGKSEEGNATRTRM